MSVVEVATLDGLRDILSAHPDVVVLYGANWCSPCTRFKPHFEAFAERTGVTSVYCTIEEDPAVQAEYGIQSIPQVWVFKNGQYADELRSRTAVPLIAEYLSQT